MRYFYCLSLCLLLAFSQLYAQNFFINEDFNLASLPTGWTNSAVSGTQVWSFGSIGSNNLNGTAMAFFDDDALGAASTNNTASLTSPSFDNSADSVIYLEFDYNFRQFNGITDSFYVEVFDGSSWQRVRSIGIDDCGNWQAPACRGSFPRASIDISAYKNVNCQVRFIYSDGNDWAWYLGIDNVLVYSVLANDLSIVDFNPILNSCNLADSLRVRIANKGVLAQSNFSIAYQLNGTAPVSAAYPGTLNRDDTVVFTFPNPLNFNTGNNSLRIYTDLINDLDRSNDSLQSTVYKAQVQNLPFIEDFETDAERWKVSGLNPSWEIGIPSASLIDSASGGKKILATNLNGNYNSNELSYITSPCLSLGNNLNAVRIGFDLIYRTERLLDQMWLEYSTDNGSSWQKIVEDNLSYSKWYNVQSNQVFSGSNSIQNQKYARISTQLRGLGSTSNLLIRFVFSSDLSVNREGVGIDNLMVSEFDDQDILMDLFISPANSGLCKFDSSHLTVQLINLSNDPFIRAELVYQVNGGGLVRDSLIDSLANGVPYNFTFTQAFNFSNLTNFQLKSWLTTIKDSLRMNDTTYTDIQNPLSNSFAPPYYEDFDSSLSLNTEWNVIPSSTFTPISWVVLPSLPNRFDATGKNYLRSSLTSPDQEAGLASPCIELIAIPKPILYFKYDNGPMVLDLYESNTWHFGIDTIPTHVSNPNWINWKGHRTDLKAYSDKTIKLKFRGINQSLSYLDDIRIINTALSPYKLESISMDSSNCIYGSTPDVSIKLNKYLVESIPTDSLSFELKLNGITVAIERFQNAIDAEVVDTTFSFNFRPTLNQIGNNEIKVLTSLNYNGITYSDSISDNFITKIDQLPYEQGFEGLFLNCYEYLRSYEEFDFGSGWTTEKTDRFGWHVTDTTFCTYQVWQGLGGVANSGPKTTYDSTAFLHFRSANSFFDRILYTPCFDLSSYNQVELEYWYHRYANANMGNLKLEVNHNGQWILIDRIDTVFASQNSAWQRSQIDITPYIGTSVQFRYRIDSLPPTSQTDNAIDAFKIFDPLVTDVETLETLPQTLALYPNPNNGEFTVKVPEQLIGKRFDIINLSGKVLKSSTFRRSTEDIQIDAEKGVYILRVPQHGVHQKVVVY